MSELYRKHCDEYIKRYEKYYAWFAAKDSRVKAMKLFKNASTVVMYAAYVILLAGLALNRDPRIIRAIAVPAAVFFLVTAVRAKINAPRPYEKYPVKPVLHKSTKGNSCPSRHTACAAVIALTCLYINLPAGIILLILSVLIAVSRPLIGVHFPLDVVFGFLLAAMPAVVGLWII